MKNNPNSEIAHQKCNKLKIFTQKGFRKAHAIHAQKVIDGRHEFNAMTF